MTKTHPTTVEFATLSAAFNYAGATHLDAVEAVAKAKEALLAAQAVEQGTAAVKATLRKLMEEAQS